jgi:hypothetical protein
MAYALENALFQWAEGERRVRETGQLERSVAIVQDELRRRLGGSFTVEELAEFYAGGTEWAEELAHGASSGATWVVDAAFNRYAREARNYAGGRARERHDRPDSRS